MAWDFYPAMSGNIAAASTRRLFRWGNQLHRNLFEPEDSHLYKKNMFGLEIANMGWGPELVEDGLLVKGGWISIQAENILRNSCRMLLIMKTMRML